MKKLAVKTFVKISLLSYLLILICCNGVFAREQKTFVNLVQTDEIILENFAQLFCQAYVEKNTSKLESGCISGTDGHIYENNVKQIFSYPEQIETIKDTLVKVEVKANDLALIKIGLVFKAFKTSDDTSTKESQKRSFLLECRKEKGQWCINNIKNYQDVIVEKLLAMESSFERQSLLKQEKDFCTLEVARKLYQKGSAYFKDGNRLDASNVFSVALEVVDQRLGDPDYPVVATAVYIGLGLVYSTEDKVQVAIEYLQKALKLTQENNNKVSMSRIYTNLANCYYLQGNSSKTLEYYQKSLEIKLELKDEKGIAQVYNNLGLVYQSLGDDQAAYEAMQKSLAIHEKLKNLDGIVNICNNLGNYFFSYNDYVQAKAFFEKALLAAEESKNQAAIALTYHNLAGVHRYQGDFKTALKYYFDSVTILEKLKDIDSLGKAYTSVGIIYQEQGDTLTALKYYQRRLKILNDRVNKAEKAFVLNLIGVAYRTMGQTEEALSYYRESLELKEQIGQKIRIAESLLNLGNTYVILGKYEEAEKLYKRSLDNASSSLSLQVEIWNALAELYETKNKYEEALGFSRKAIELTKKIKGFNVLWECRDTAGRILLKLNRLDEAREFFQESIAIIEKTRNQLAGSQENQPNFFVKRVSPYHGLIKLLLKQQNNYEALHYAEMSKSRVLLDVLQFGRVNIKKYMTSLQKDEEEKLKKEISIAQAKLELIGSKIDREKNNEDDVKRLIIEQEKLQKHLVLTQENLQIFWQKLYAQIPQLKSQRAEEEPIYKTDISSLLPNTNRALLEYVVMEDACYLFLLSKKKNQGEVNDAKNPGDIDLSVYYLDISKSNLNELISKFRTSLIGNVKSDYLSIGQLLYQKLILPIQDKIEDKEELIIVPDDIMWMLPFQSLVQKTRNGGISKFLIESKAISYSPSLTALKEMSKLSKQNKKKYQQDSLLVFANPIVPKDTFVFSSQAEAEAEVKITLKPLIDAEQLVKELTNQYGTSQIKYYVNSDATEKQLKSIRDNYKTIIFATHGILNESDPMSSGVILSKEDTSDLEDGFLQAREIAEMNLNADMVILSACDTGLGQLNTGEGIIGLMWSVFVAGCPSTVVTQWKVKSDSTKDFVINFYNKLQRKSGISKAEALRQTAIELIKSKKFSSPYYWGAFNVVGNIDSEMKETAMDKEDKELVIKNYEKSLEINPKNENAKDQLKKQ